MIFGLALLPLPASIGRAIDYSLIARVKTKLQSAVDQTALAGANAKANIINPSPSSTAAGFHRRGLCQQRRVGISEPPHD